MAFVFLEASLECPTGSRIRFFVFICFVLARLLEGTSQLLGCITLLPFCYNMRIPYRVATLAL